MLVAPYMDEAERCTQVAFLDGGRVRQLGTPAEIKALVPGRLFQVAAADARAAMAAVVGAPGVLAVHLYGEFVRVLVESDDLSPVRAALAAAGISAHRSGQPSTWRRRSTFAELTVAPPRPGCRHEGLRDQVGAIVRKEVIHLARDPRMLAVVLVMPVLLMLLFAYAISFDKNVATVIVDQTTPRPARPTCAATTVPTSSPWWAPRISARSIGRSTTTWPGSSW